MQTDPASLDPEEKLYRFYALFSIALGILSLCVGLIPALGTILGVVGVLFGMLSRKSEYKRMAWIGIGFSCIGFLTAIIYSLLVYFAS